MYMFETLNCGERTCQIIFSDYKHITLNFVDYRICISSHPYDSPTAVDSFWYRVLDGTARMYQIFTAKVKTGVYGAIFGLV